MGILKTAFFLIQAVCVAGGVGALAWAASSQSAPRHASSQVAPAVAQTETAVAPEVTIELDEATLSSELNAQLAGRPLAQTPLGAATARGLAIHLGDGQLEVSGTAQAGVLSTPLDLTAVVSVQARRILVQVQDVRMGGVPLPEVTRRGVEQVLQDQVDRELVQRRVTPRSATITQGKLVLVGTPA